MLGNSGSIDTQLTYIFNTFRQACMRNVLKPVKKRDYQNVVKKFSNKTRKLDLCDEIIVFLSTNDSFDEWNCSWRIVDGIMTCFVCVVAAVVIELWYYLMNCAFLKSWQMSNLIQRCKTKLYSRIRNALQSAGAGSPIEKTRVNSASGHRFESGFGRKKKLWCG